MSILLTALVATLGVVVLHMCWSRLRRPANHALLIIQLAALCSVISMVFFVFKRLPLDAEVPELLADLFRLGLLEFSLMATYLGLFTAVEDDGPSMTIARIAANAGANGAKRQDFLDVLHPEMLFARRVEAMERDGWILLDAEQYRLTSLGAWWARFFRSGQRLFGLEEKQ
jgi:hypothetical protein